MLQTPFQKNSAFWRWLCSCATRSKSLRFHLHSQVLTSRDFWCCLPLGTGSYGIFTKRKPQMAQRFAMRIGAIRANWFARIDSQESPYSITFERFARIASNMRFAFFSAPNAIRKKGVHLGNPEMIRANRLANQAIRANLRIDSCESGILAQNF